MAEEQKREYWKFKAFDQFYNVHEGVVSSHSPEICALKLRQNGLQLMKMDLITEAEYKRIKGKLSKNKQI